MRHAAHATDVDGVVDGRGVSAAVRRLGCCTSASRPAKCHGPDAQGITAAGGMASLAREVGEPQVGSAVDTLPSHDVH